MVILIHLLPVAALLCSLIISPREGYFVNGFLGMAGVILILTGLILTDAASEIKLFICVGFDIIAGVLSFIAIYFRGHLVSEK